MAISSLSIPTAIHQLLLKSHLLPSSQPPPHSFLPPSSFSTPLTSPSLTLCRASTSSSSSSSSSPRNTTTTTKKKKKKKAAAGGSGGHDVALQNLSLTDAEIVKAPDDVDSDDDYFDDRHGVSTSNSRYNPQPPTPMPKPPTGFTVSSSGKVSVTSENRIATIVDAANNSPLECIIRRKSRTSQGAECMLLCPADTPVYFLKNTTVDGWTAASDDEVEAVLPAAAFALAKIHLHLVHSGFCYTARGSFFFSEDDIFDFNTDDEEIAAGLPTEGVEIAYFHLDGTQFMLYTPLEPILFVAIKDQDGVLQIANDELLDDPAIISMIDEETEFNALVEEEAALMNSLMGKG
ncbi:hypothetical protein LINGRAHAP2_LOCUS11880 [Linum grandiflorum]